MWSVPFNLNLYDTYLGLAMIYNQVRNLVAGVIGFIPCIQGPFSSSSYWFKKMYYSDIGPHVRGQGGKILMYEERFIFFLSTSDIISSELLEMAFYSLSNVVIENKSFSTEFSYNNIWLHWGMNIWIFPLARKLLNIQQYFQAWTYHPMLNISVIPQRKYNLAPSVINKLYNPTGAKVTSLTSSLL